jgi:hypothetical protein
MRRFSAADHPVHRGFANTAESGGLGNFVIVRREVGHAAPWLARSAASETEELAGGTFPFPGLLPPYDEDPQH